MNYNNINMFMPVQMLYNCYQGNYLLRVRLFKENMQELPCVSVCWIDKKCTLKETFS